MKDIKQIKKELRISDEDIAKAFNYASASAYRNSSAKQRIEAGITFIYKQTVQKLKTDLKDILD